MQELASVGIVSCLAVVLAGVIGTAFDGLVEWRRIDDQTAASVRKIEANKHGYVTGRMGF